MFLVKPITEKELPFQKQPANGQPFKGQNRNPNSSLKGSEIQQPNNRSNLSKQADEEEGEEDGEEEFEEEFDEDNPSAGNSLRKSQKSHKSLGLTRNTFHDAERSLPQLQQDTNHSNKSLKNKPLPNKQQTQNSQIKTQPSIPSIKNDIPLIDPAERELIEKQMQMKQNLQNMKAELMDSPPQKKDSKKDMINMFQESFEKKPQQIVQPKNDQPIVSRDLNTAIDAYQKQMREFKNSLTEMDNKFANPIISPIEQNYRKIDEGNSITSQNQINTFHQTGESQVYNSVSNKSNNNVFAPINEVKPLIQKTPAPNIENRAINLNDRKKTNDSPLGQNKMNVGPSKKVEEDQDFEKTNKEYYNFDNGYQKSEGPVIRNNYQAKQSSLNNIAFVNKDPKYQTETPVGRPPQQQFQPMQQQQPIQQYTPQPQIISSYDNDSSNQYQNVQKDRLNVQDLQRIKDNFLEQEERERLNPQNVLIRILMIHAFNDGNDYKNDEMILERKLYSFFINKNSNVIDVKNKIRKEFGFDVDQINMYFKYRELSNIQYVMDVENFDIEEDIIICITLNSPKSHLKVILREPLDDIKIADVRFLNSKDRSEPALRGPNSDFPSIVDMNKFDVDVDKLSWPFYRDWTAEAAYLSDLIIKNKNFLLSDEQQFQMQQGFTSTLHNNPQLNELIEAETQYRRLSEEFRKASLYAVHLVVKKNPTPLNLFNLYGDDGDKFIVGGMIIRRAKDWLICGHQLSETHHMTATVPGGPGVESGSALIQISGKIASLDVRNLALLRNRLEQLVVPLACVVDYYGLKFEVQSLSPISINSLAYGSDLDGLLFTDEDTDAEQMAAKISQVLNLKTHFIEEKTTKKIKRTFLPYTVQLHRNREMGDSDKKLYLINPFRLFPQDESLRQQNQQSSFLDLLSKQLRSELVISNNKNEPAPNFTYFTWKRPIKCDECGEYILDYQYYYFEKKSVDKQQRLLVQYYCCIKCYNELLPTERFKYPVNKIVFKELASKDRLEFWEDQNTGRRYYELQYRKIPLNSDAFMDISNTKDKNEKISDQEEILRAGQKLKDEILQRLIEELNNVDEDPQTAEQLEFLLHSRGVTMRHLGKLCTLAQLNHIRELAVIEVIARSAKILIKDGLTFLADDEEAGFRQENIKKCVLHYLHEIFNMDEYQTTSTQNIWDFITEHARKKFQVTVERDVLHKIHLNALLISICDKLNIKLTKSVKDINFYQSASESGEAFVTINDIENIIPSVKDYQDQMMTNLALMAPQDKFPSSLHMILDCARLKDNEGKRSQWYMIGGDERVESTELFRMAINICESIYGGQQSIHYARVLKEMAEQLESRHQERGRPENSRWNKSFAVSEDELSMESRYYFQNSLQVLIDIKKDLSIEAAQIYVALARLFKPRATQFSHYREQENNIGDMYQNLANAIDIYETLLGFDHPETADTYTKMAFAYQENGSFIAASPWIRRAFCVFYKCFGPHDDITLNAWETLKAIETNIDSKLDQVAYEELPNVIFELEKQQKIINEQQQQMALQQQNMVMPPHQRSGQYPQIPAFQNQQRLMLR